MTPDPLDEVARLSSLYASLTELQGMVQDQLKPAIIAALKAGYMPTEVTAASPYTDAWVRKLAREAGVPPARRGPKRKKPGW